MYWCRDEQSWKIPPWPPKTKRYLRGAGEHNSGESSEHCWWIASTDVVMNSLGRFPPWLPKTKQCWKGSGEHSGGAATELDSSIHLFEQFYHLGSVKSLQMTTSPDQLSSLTCLCQIFLRSATKRKAYSNMVEEHETENKTPKSYFCLTAALSECWLILTVMWPISEFSFNYEHFWSG